MGEIELLLPPKEAVANELSGDALARHLVQVFEESLPFVVRGMKERRVKSFYQAQENGWGSYIAQVPTRYSQSFWDEIYAAIEQGVFTKLVDYLWECGEPQIRLTGSNPDKEGWSYFMIPQYVVTPLYEEIVRAMDEELVLRADFNLPCLTRSDLHQLAHKISEQWIRKEKRIKVTFFSRNIDLVDLKTADLGNGIEVRTFDNTDLCLFLTRNHSVFLEDEKFLSAIGMETTVSISFDVALNMSDAEIMDKVIQKLDVLRIAVGIAEPNATLVGEGLVIIGIEHPFSPYRSLRLLRDRINTWTPLSLNKDNVGGLKSEINKLISLCEEILCLSHAVWRFGRACVAPTSQDRLVESVVGLERLAIGDSRELRYRFSMNAAILIMSEGDVPEEIVDAMKHLYDQRSKAVHGRTSLEMAQYADKAVHSLVKAIATVLDLYKQNILIDQNVAKTIEQHILGGLKGLRVR